MSIKEDDALRWVPVSTEHEEYIQQAQQETARRTYGREATHAERARWRQELELALQNSSHHVGVLYQGSDIAGYYWFQERESHVAYLLDLFVDPSKRGMGLGDIIFSQVVTHATSNGCTELKWVVARDNAAARKLFKRYGTDIESEIKHERLIEMHTYILSL